MAVLCRKTPRSWYEQGPKFLWPAHLCFTLRTQPKRFADCNKLPPMRWRKKFEVPVVKIARTFGLAFVVAGLAIPAHGHLLHKKKKPPPVTTTDSVAPDKELYEKAEDGIKHGRYEVARLQLNTLLNAYPDSEYLAKAKLAVADSYFKEG